MSDEQIEGVARSIVGSLHKCHYPLPVASDDLYAGHPTLMLTILDWGLVHFSTHVKNQFSDILPPGTTINSLDDISFSNYVVRFLRDTIGVRPPLQAAQLLSRPGAFVYKKLCLVSALLKGALSLHGGAEAARRALHLSHLNGLTASSQQRNAAMISSPRSDGAIRPSSAPAALQLPFTNGVQQQSDAPSPRRKLPPLPPMPWQWAIASEVVDSGPPDLQQFVSAKPRPQHASPKASGGWHGEPAELREGEGASATTDTAQDAMLLSGSSAQGFSIQRQAAAGNDAPATKVGPVAIPVASIGVPSYDIHNATGSQNGPGAGPGDDLNFLLERLVQRCRATDELIARAGTFIRGTAP